MSDAGGALAVLALPSKLQTRKLTQPDLTQQNAKASTAQWTLRSNSDQAPARMSERKRAGPVQTPGNIERSTLS